MVQALRADERGKRLLVGRDDLVKLVAQRLHKHGKITCLDGHVGVGKTSLVNVASYECFQAFLKGETTQLLIPLHEAFQLMKDEDVNQFCDKVFLKVANGLLSQREHLSNYTLTGPSLQHVEAWLNSPIIQHLNGALSGGFTMGVPGVISATLNATGTGSNQINTSAGFSQDGFERLVRDWLNEIFHVQGNGGVVCVIDNLELLETGATVRRTLEALRDRLFNINGLRWVLCGANGVVHSLAASPRLGSFLNTPIIEVQNITQDFIEPLVRARLDEFSHDSKEVEAALPIRLYDLQSLYLIINYNLRDLLHYADEYCEQELNHNRTESTESEKERRYLKWLNKNSTESYRNLASRISQDAWVVLDIAMSSPFNGTFGAGDYGSFSSDSLISFTQGKFKKWLRDLIKLGLLSESIVDTVGEDDCFKRDVFSVTAKGALVHYARFTNKETRSLGSPCWLKRVHY
jgi:hypothetical protein